MDSFPSVESLGHWERKTINDVTQWQTMLNPGLTGKVNPTATVPQRLWGKLLDLI